MQAKLPDFVQLPSRAVGPAPLVHIEADGAEDAVKGSIKALRGPGGLDGGPGRVQRIPIRRIPPRRLMLLKLLSPLPH